MGVDSTVDGVAVFRAHRFIWWFMVPGRTDNYTALRYIYSILMTILVIFGFPAHLLIGLAQSKSQEEVLSSLAVTVPVTVCSLKTLCIWWKLGQVHKIDEIIHRLDRRILESDEIKYYKEEVLHTVNRMMFFTGLLCMSAVVFMELGVIIRGIFSEWHLMYQGYVPFDVYGSTIQFFVANFYQFIALCGVAFQALANEMYAPNGLAMIAGHVHVLRLRVSKLGSKPKKLSSENNADLIQCIRTHKDILEFHRVLHDIISFYMMVQIIVSAINMCVVLINVIYYVDDLFAVMYYMIIWIATLVEVFPCCYYGSVLEAEFYQLTQSISECNWVDQNQEFGRNLMVLMGLSLKKITSEAGGGLIHINLDSFLRACRVAYSLFVLLMQTK